VVDSVCKFGESIATTHAVFSGTFESAYRVETSSTYEPPMAGVKEEQRDHRGALGLGLQGRPEAGRMILSNRMKFTSTTRRPDTADAAAIATQPRPNPQAIEEPPWHTISFDSLQEFPLGAGEAASSTRFRRSKKAGVGRRLAAAGVLRIVLESVLRNCDGKKVSEAHVRELANWNPTASRTTRSRRGGSGRAAGFHRCALLADLAAMRNVAARLLAAIPNHRAPGAGRSRRRPLGDGDHWREPNALELNMKLEFARNGERYES